MSPKKRHEPTSLTEGAAALRSYLSPSMTQVQLADALGVSQQAVWNWINGLSRPSPPLAEALERIAGIPARSWLSDADMKQAEKAEKRAKTGTGR